MSQTFFDHGAFHTENGSAHDSGKHQTDHIADSCDPSSFRRPIVINARESRANDPLEFLSPFDDELEDAFDSLLDVIRCTAPTYRVFERSGTWFSDTVSARDVTAYYIVSGNVELAHGTETVMELHQGDYALVSPQEPHRLQSARPQTDVLVGKMTFGLDIVRAQPLFRTLPAVMLLQNSHDDVRDHKNLARLIVNFHDQNEIGNRALIRRSMETSLILSILTYRKKKADADGNSRFSSLYSRISPALKAMHSSPSLNWSLAKLAKESGLSRSLFSSEFKRATGETAMRYLARIRLEHTKDLLQHSELSLGAIASRVGYSDEMTLGRSFRREFGRTLYEFRSSFRRSIDH